MHLWRHVLWRAAARAALHVVSLERFGKTKVGNFQHCFFCATAEHDILRFEVAVHNILKVAVGDAVEEV